MEDMKNYIRKILGGRYEVTELIGVGGMAVVYKAYDRLEDRIVALKILKEEFLANSDYIRRFKNESKAIAMLSHPNIVGVYDVDYGERLQYIVMEYVEGITLNEYIEQVKQVTVPDALHFVTEILRALQHAHDRGIIHRDIKPHNIIILKDGSIKVTDFGIASLNKNEKKDTAKNTIGSVHYFSPEQAKGQQTDERSDIYSVGVVLYEMLTGRLPFQGENSVSVAMMQVNSEPERPSKFSSGINLGLEQIILKAMKKDPEKRYQSAAGMLLDISDYKRNPDAEFGYSIPEDKSPTKHVDFIFEENVAENRKAKTPQQGSRNSNKKVPHRKLPFFVGVLAGILMLAVVVGGGLALFTDVFSESKVTVPNFVGKDYMTEVKNNKDYSGFLILAEEVQNSQYESGIVFQQDPPYGTRINKDKQVTLKVAVGTKMETIPNVNNHDFAEVKKTLEQMGFVVEGVAESSQLKFGTVIRTSPEQGTQVPQNSTVFIYYASDENLIEVPLLIGWTVEDAKRLLESLNLSLDENISYENSDQPEGTIIKQSPDEKLKVITNSKVSVTVSTGIASKATVDLSFKLPSRPAGTIGALMVTLNNDVISEKNVLLDGNNYTMEVEGSGAENALKVFVDSKMIYSCKIDFTTKPASIKDEKVFDIPTSAIIPNVVGKEKDDAVERLNNAGFNNIVIVEKTVINPFNAGKVQSQNPEYRSFISRPLDTQITLEIGVLP